MKNHLKKLDYPEEIGYSPEIVFLFFALYYDIHTAIKPFLHSHLVQAMHDEKLFINEFKSGNRFTLKTIQNEVVRRTVNYIVKNKIQRRTNESALEIALG